MKLASESKKERSQKYGFANAAVLAAGLIFSSCHSERPANSQPTHSVTSGASAHVSQPAASATNLAPTEEYQTTCRERREATQSDSSRVIDTTLCSPLGCFPAQETVSTTTVRMGDRLPFGEPYALRVSRIDGSGVDFILGGPRPQDSELIRYNYGQESRIGEFVLVATLRAEPGTVPGTARIVSCMPVVPR
jgi:hypothetical protein